VFPEVPSIVIDKLQVGQVHMLLDMKTIPKITLPDLKAQRVHAHTGEFNRESALQTTKVCYPQTLHAGRVKGAKQTLDRPAPLIFGQKKPGFRSRFPTIIQQNIVSCKLTGRIVHELSPDAVDLIGRAANVPGEGRAGCRPMRNGRPLR
jgi:hypothetical protein